MATTKQHDENYVKKLIKKWLDEQGAWHFPIPANGMGVSGLPDRIAVFDEGLLVAIEAKRPGRRGEVNRGCSALQVKALRAIAAKGGIAWVVDGEEDLEALLLAVRTRQPSQWLKDHGLEYARKYGSFNEKTNLDLEYWRKK